MNGFFSWQYLQTMIIEMQNKVVAGTGGLSLGLQIAIIAVIILAVFLLGDFVRQGMMRLIRNVIQDETSLSLIDEKLVKIAKPLLAAVLLWIVFLIAKQHLWGHNLISIAMKLCWAWTIIRLFTSFIAQPVWAKILAVSIWTVAAMDILSILRPSIEVLDKIGLGVGDERISLWLIIETAIILALLIPISGRVINFIQPKIEQSPSLTPKVQVLLIKLLKIVLYTVVILVALDSVGFDFHLLAVFSGAVGLGVGFGLRKVVSNLVSGVIILMDNSIRPGDVIEIEGVYGWIESLHARFVSVVTRDGTSFLIPNDDLISNKVINWSFSGHGKRLRLPVGISYNSDVHQAMDLMVAAAKKFSRVLKHPAPSTRLIEFGDSSIRLELRVWIRDPQKGVRNIQSQILLSIWDAFHEHQIEFPFPQRDLSLRSAPEITVRLKEKPEAVEGKEYIT